MSRRSERVANRLASMQRSMSNHEIEEEEEEAGEGGQREEEEEEVEEEVEEGEGEEELNDDESYMNISSQYNNNNRRNDRNERIEGVRRIGIGRGRVSERGRGSGRGRGGLIRSGTIDNDSDNNNDDDSDNNNNNNNNDDSDINNIDENNLSYRSSASASASASGSARRNLRSSRARLSSSSSSSILNRSNNNNNNRNNNKNPKKKPKKTNNTTTVDIVKGELVRAMLYNTQNTRPIDKKDLIKQVFRNKPKVKQIDAFEKMKEDMSHLFGIEVLEYRNKFYSRVEPFDDGNEHMSMEDREMLRNYHSEKLIESETRAQKHLRALISLILSFIILKGGCARRSEIEEELLNKIDCRNIEWPIINGKEINNWHKLFQEMKLNKWIVEYKDSYDIDYDNHDNDYSNISHSTTFNSNSNSNFNSNSNSNSNANINSNNMYKDDDNNKIEICYKLGLRSYFETTKSNLYECMYQWKYNSVCNTRHDHSLKRLLREEKDEWEEMLREELNSSGKPISTPNTSYTQDMDLHNTNATMRGQKGIRGRGGRGRGGRGQSQGRE